MNQGASSTDGGAAERPNSRFDFGLMAETYDLWYEKPVGRVFDAIEKRAVSRVLPGPRPGARLLDVGCGTGHWSAFFSSRGYAVTGVDIAPEMVAFARRKQIAGASFEVADAHELPFGAGRFDVTAAVTTLEFVRQAEAVLREMVRCTRSPGGMVLVGVLNALAAVNIERQDAGQAPYAGARLFSPGEVEALLEPHGRVKVCVAGFVPRRRAVLFLAPLADLLGRVFRSQRGAFIVGRAVM